MSTDYRYVFYNNGKHTQAQKDFERVEYMLAKHNPEEAVKNAISLVASSRDFSENQKHFITGLFEAIKAQQLDMRDDFSLVLVQMEKDLGIKISSF